MRVLLFAFVYVILSRKCQWNGDDWREVIGREANAIRMKMSGIFKLLGNVGATQQTRLCHFNWYFYFKISMAPSKAPPPTIHSILLIQKTLFGKILQSNLLELDTSCIESY